MGRPVPRASWLRYAQDRIAGATRQDAAVRHGIAYNTCAKFDRGDQGSSGYVVWTGVAHMFPFSKEHAEAVQGRGENPAAASQRVVQSTDVVCHNPEARKALDDFSLFRRRYFGEVSLPWHVEVSEKIITHLEERGQSFIILNAPPGSGKALALDTPLPTPGGWTTMKDVEVGDELFDDAGRPCRVVAKSEVFYGHECFEVSTDDGASVIADAGHLWPVRLHGFKPRPDYPGKTGPKPQSTSGVHVHSTAFLARARSKRPMLAVAYPLNTDYRPLPLDPYVLGVWLGDGDSKSATITDPPADAVFMRRHFAEAGWTTTDRKDPMRFGVSGLGKKLRTLGVWANKHIPAQYLRACSAQRLALLQGLIDTDGHVDENGEIEFTSTNRNLAEGCRQLALSLGVKASLSEGRATLYGKDCGPKYRVLFYMAGAARIPRKAERCRDGARTPNRYLTITPCESVPTQCIQVDSPSHLFLAGEGMMVTHNSALVRAIGLWVTVRNRAIRGARLSNSANLATREVRLMRRHLERTTAVLQKPTSVRDGLACDALSTLAEDYGRFRPEMRDQWSAEAFVVMQPNGVLVSEKEPTWSAYGMDSVLLGNRLDLLLGDDIDTPKSVRATEATRDAFFFDWDNEVEPRLEPNGLIALIMQRLGVRDISRYCADKTVPSDDVEVINIAEGGKQYHHFVYPAHDDELCRGEHSKASEPWPKGCLLDPYRVPWSKLVTLRDNQPHTFHTVYQQRDGDPSNGRFDSAWIDGGKGRDGLEYAGCWDRTRSIWQLPERCVGGVGVITVDPSGTQRWACQAWLAVPPLPTRPNEPAMAPPDTLAHQRILLDVRDGPMQAPDLLDWSHAESVFHGLLEEWRKNFAEIGRRLDVVIVEINVMQRYLLQFEHAKRWARQSFVRFLPHTTGVMKTDARLGVEAMSGAYQFGLVRLPAGDEVSRRTVRPLVEQIRRWPDTQREDQVMANWFLEFNLAKVAPPPGRQGPGKQWRPSWIAA